MENGFIFNRALVSREKNSVLFRKQFDCFLSKNNSAVISISADARYLLYVNGQPVCRGPEPGNAYCKYFDEVDIAPYLVAGKNCISAQVLHYSVGDHSIQNFQFGPTALPRSQYGGLYVRSHNAALDVDTNASWKVQPDKAYRFCASVQAKYAGDMEEVDLAARDDGWNMPDYDDSAWQSAVLVQAAYEYNPFWDYGILGNWLLQKRDIPMMQEHAIRAASARCLVGNIDFTPLLSGSPVTVPAGTTATWDIDMGRVVTAYVRTHFTCGENGRAEYLYSENYYLQSDNGLVKARRDDAENGVLYGEKDTVFLAVGPCDYEPFEYRAFRYLRLSVTAADVPVTLGGICFCMTGYPLTIKQPFYAQNQDVQNIWAVSVRTLRRCAQEMYIDCPYYERVQYVLDALIEASVTYPLTGDGRLARKALADFAATQMPGGLINCDAPAIDRHIIPAYGLYYIDMLYRYFQYFGDLEVLADYLPVCDGILRFFEKRLHPATSILQNCSYWEFVDWTPEWNANQGRPGKGPDEPQNYIYTLIYAFALKQMASLCEAAYGPAAAQRWAGQHTKLVAAANREIYSAESGWYRTGPYESGFCQHAQVWAVLSGCVMGEAAASLMRKTIRDNTLVRCSYPMLFYLNRALALTGVYPEYTDMWEQYRALLDLGLTTWPEDAVNSRSDCHGWSTVPLYEMYHELLGVQPLKPGFEEVLVAPKCFEMGTMEGAVCTPWGAVTVKRGVKEDGNGRFGVLEITSAKPVGLRVEIAGAVFAWDYGTFFTYQFPLDAPRENPEGGGTNEG